MKKLVSLVLALFAASAPAQVSNRGVTVKDEGSQLGFARSVDFVGSSVSCGISGGQATCTFTAGGLAVGSAISSGTNGRLLYQDASGNLAQSANLTFDGTLFQVGSATTSGNATLKLNRTISGSSSTSNFFNITGTFPATLSAVTNGASFSFTGDNDAQVQNALTSLLAGSTGTADSRAGYFDNQSQGSGTNAFTNASVGVEGAITSGLPSMGVGVRGTGKGGAGGTSVGVVGNSSGTGTNRVGVWGNGFAQASIQGVGVLATLGSNPALPTLPATHAALLADNGSASADVLLARDNGAALPTTGATATWSVGDGAIPRVGTGVLTTATMTAEAQAYARGSMVHSATWSNAQIVALGAVTAGDITAFTLPAKHVVENAYVIITGQGAGTTTLTVSCGRTSASYIDYIVASDAKAAANTVYGDASAERGTNLTGYDLPSYTGTTSIVCNFVSTGANLDQVTGSTGRVVLVSTMVP